MALHGNVKWTIVLAYFRTLKVILISVILSGVDSIFYSLFGRGRVPAVLADYFFKFSTYNRS
jgi:hypothetical protein